MLQKNAIPEKKVEGKRKPPVTNVAKLDARHPIPLDTGRAFSFANNVSYLPFLNPKDNFGRMLLESRLLSNTNNACVGTKAEYCAGAGFQDVANKEFDQRIVDWFKSMNLKNEPLVSINEKVFEDFFTWGNVPIQVVRFTAMKEKKLFIYPQNFLEWRLCKPDDDDIVHEAIKSKLFLRDGFITADLLKTSIKLPIYNPNNSERENWYRDSAGTERTLIWYKKYVSGMPHYGLPSNIASLIFQLLEYKGARYDLDLFDNDMVAATVVALKGNVSAPEAKRIGQDLVNTYSGDGRRGRTLVIASEDGIDGSDIHKMETEREGSYNQSDDRWTQKIIWANNWDSVLAGLISASTMGKGAGFLGKIIENKLNFVIKPAQRKLMEKVWNDIFIIAQKWMGLPFDQYEIEFKNAIDISGLTDVDITPAVQINEVRKAKGLPEDKKLEGVYMPTRVSWAAPPPASDTPPTAASEGDPKNQGG